MPRRYASELRRLGEVVVARRRELGWSRRDLAKQTDISERFLADVETGKANPSLAKLLDLADALGIEADELLRKCRQPRAARPIALLGLRGAGKSTVGLALAKRLSVEFVELDRKVEERVGLTLAELFEMHGEAYYRREERAALDDLLAGQGAPVVATGGGLVTEPATFALLRSRALTVWLRAEPEDHWERVVAQGDTRPMANREHAYQQMCELLAARERLYRQAGWTVETSGRSIARVVDELAARLAEKRPGRAPE